MLYFLLLDMINSDFNPKYLSKMKKQKTLLASIALGIFMLAVAAPIVTLDDNDNGIKKSSVKRTGKINKN